jgi:hypothetical protein
MPLGNCVRNSGFLTRTKRRCFAAAIGDEQAEELEPEGTRTVGRTYTLGE